MDDTVPPSELHAEMKEFQFRKVADVAQYKGSDYANAVRVERGISLDQAFEIANSDPEIDYFVYTKGIAMILEIPSDAPFNPEQDPFHLVTYGTYRMADGSIQRGGYRAFHLGDVVFFKKEGEWLGSANGLADAYFKE